MRKQRSPLIYIVSSTLSSCTFDSTTVQKIKNTLEPIDKVVLKKQNNGFNKFKPKQSWQKRK